MHHRSLEQGAALDNVKLELKRTQDMIASLIAIFQPRADVGPPSLAEAALVLEPEDAGAPSVALTHNKAGSALVVSWTALFTVSTAVGDEDVTQAESTAFYTSRSVVSWMSSRRDIIAWTEDFLSATRSSVRSPRRHLSASGAGVE